MSDELLIFDSAKEAAENCGAAIFDLLAAARRERPGNSVSGRPPQKTL